AGRVRLHEDRQRDRRLLQAHYRRLQLGDRQSQRHVGRGARSSRGKFTDVSDELPYPPPPSGPPSTDPSPEAGSPTVPPPLAPPAPTQAVPELPPAPFSAPPPVTYPAP